MKEKSNFCDIWREFKNCKIKHFTFWQQHASRLIQKRLDYFFVSNLLQESVNKTDVLAAFSTDHSPLLNPQDLHKNGSRGK